MPVLKHKTPCNDCPFRRNSMMGWLGDSSPQLFATQIGEIALPCHQTIDYDDPNWRETQYPESAHCAGALILAKNQSKMPIDPELKAAVDAVEKNTVGVFQWAFEFIQHHLSGEFKSWES